MHLRTRFHKMNKTASEMFLDAKYDWEYKIIKLLVNLGTFTIDKTQIYKNSCGFWAFIYLHFCSVSMNPMINHFIFKTVFWQSPCMMICVEKSRASNLVGNHIAEHVLTYYHKNAHFGESQAGFTCIKFILTIFSLYSSRSVSVKKHVKQGARKTQQHN